MGRARIRESSFVLKVALMTVVPMVALAVVLGHSLGATVREHALDGAESEAALVKRLAGEGALASAARAGRTRRGPPEALARRLKRLVGVDEVTALGIVDRRGQVVYATDKARKVPAEGEQELREALSARRATAAQRSPEGGEPAGETYEVYVPLLAGGGSGPVGALRVALDAGPIESAIAADTRKLYLFLAIGLGVLCAALVRTVTGASSRMKSQAAGHEHAALRDTLTDLPNRALFNRQLESALTACPPDGQVAVLLMDLDRFKEINDTLGHFNGDLVIQRVGERLRTVLREEDSVGRLGGDEFAMLLPKAHGRDAAITAATRVHQALEEPFTAGGLRLKVEASIGIAVYPEHGGKAGALMRAADVAMYAAKKAHTGHEVYAPDQQQYSPARLGLVAELSRAMEKRELVLHYQPKARLATGEVAGVEALVRWQHPQRGLLYPDEFIPVTEHTQMIRPVTFHLLETALERVFEWRSNGIDLSVAVNLSTQMLIDLDLPDEIGRILARSRVPTRYLEIEVTESAIVYDPRRAQIVLEALHEMGLRIAIDDFGTGYSSLVSLKQLPVSAIKIDKSFVMGMEADNDDAAIVKSTVQLGRNLGLEVVAEGVESPAAWSELASLGCDYAQGYHLSKALPEAQLMRWVCAYREMFAAATGPVPAHIEIPAGAASA